MYQNLVRVAAAVPLVKVADCKENSERILGLIREADSVNGHIDGIKEVAKNVVTQYPFVLAIALYFLSCLLYSQAATTRVMMPAVAAALGMTTPENSGQIWILVASFAAVSGLFVLPTYPTTLGAIAMDDTGTTRVGKFVFNHSFFVPGTIMVALSVAFAFLIAPVLI